VRFQPNEKARLAAYASIVAIWLLLTALTWWGGGTAAPGVYGYVAFAFFTGLLFGPTAGVIAGTVSLATVGALAVLEQWELLSPPILQTPATRVLELALVLVVINGLQYRAVTTERVARARREEYLRAQKLEAIGRLASGVAHDFNNVLTVILGCSDHAIEQLEPGHPARVETEEIRRASISASALTRQLLVFSRKEAADPAPVKLGDIVESLAVMLRRLVGEHIDLVTATGMDAGHVIADPGQIEQVIMNLVVNACDAMPAGGTLTVRTGSAPIDRAVARAHGLPEGDYCTLTVKDTGSGLTPEVQARMFDPFFTTKAGDAGTGLGLATVHGIVQEAAGCVVVASAPGRGSTFVVYLPQART